MISNNFCGDTLLLNTGARLAGAGKNCCERFAGDLGIRLRV
jgi:hypothetical protein